jgi:uncharacterized membrane protein
MNKTRLETFSDGVMAIIITIMVLELKTPLTENWQDIRHLLFEIGTYLLSFVFVATFWGNHHHVLHTVQKVNAKIIWSNMLVLFCLSLIPFTTRWMGEKYFDSLTVAAYGFVLLMSSIAFYLLQSSIISVGVHHPKLLEALQKQGTKGMICVLLYIAAIPLAFVHVAIPISIFIGQAIWWTIPNKDIEKAMSE